MKRKRNFNTGFLLMLRKIGVLCKKTPPFKPSIKIQHSVNSEGDTINHEDFMFAKNILQGINNVGKNKRMCNYDFRTHTCRCGVTLEKLKEIKKCPTLN
jgi:hypothetical protein